MVASPAMTRPLFHVTSSNRSLIEEMLTADNAAVILWPRGSMAAPEGTTI
jgi:hypothetical protein